MPVVIRHSVLASVLCIAIGLAQSDTRPQPFAYETARAHELKPHRLTIPLEGVRQGFHQLRLSVRVSPSGEVLAANAAGDPATLRFWPSVQDEVRRWRFVPFETNGKAVTAEVEEYVNLVPPERLPQNHVTPPVIRADSTISITLERTACFGTCPSYRVTVSTDGITFEGRQHVVALGKHTATVDLDEVRKLARRFVASDFYSMDDSYRAGVTDMPASIIGIEIDGRAKKVVDYVGSWVGMPAVITELEDAIDTLARTKRWISGTDGQVRALQPERNIPEF